MSITPLFAMTDGGRWHPGIGDPNFMGWFTVFAYAVAAILSFRQARANRELPARFLFWVMLGTAMVLLSCMT